MTGRPGNRRIKKDATDERKPRKRVPLRKRVKRPKRKSKKPQQRKPSEDISSSSEELKQQCSPPSSPNLADFDVANEDLTECLYSDVEEQKAYFSLVNATCGHVECHRTRDSDDVSTAPCILSPSLLTADAASVASSTKATLQSTPSSSYSCQPPLASQLRPSSSLSLESASSSNTTLSSTVASCSDISAIDCFGVPNGHLSPVAGCNVSDDVSDVSSPPPPSSLIGKGLILFRNILPSCWIPLIDETGFHLLLMSKGSIKSVQRDVFISYQGKESIMVHCKPLSFESILLSSINSSPVKFEEDTVDEFVLRGHKIVQVTMQYKICVGGNYMDARDVWDNLTGTYIDTNPYQEENYEQTCRSLSCTLLIPHGRQMRCAPCEKIMRTLRRRTACLHSEEVAPSTPNMYLSKQQKLAKLQAQSEELKRRASKKAYVTGKMVKMLPKT